MNEQDTKPLEPFSLPDSPDNHTPQGTSQPTSEDKLWAGLAYWTQILLPAVFPIILLISAYTNKNQFVRYHAIHALALLVLSIIYQAIVIISIFIMSSVLPFALCLYWLLLFLVPAAVLVYYGIHAYKGETRSVPWLTGFLTQIRLI